MIRSLFGQNLKKIGEECGKPFPTENEVKKLMTYFPPPASEKWRIPILKELLGHIAEKLEIPNLSKLEVEDLLQFICTA